MNFVTVSGITYAAMIFIAILISMTLHEAMHGYMSYWLGDRTAKDLGRLTLNPLKHIDPFMTIILPISLAMFGLPPFGGAKPVPFNPRNVKWHEYGAALVALAGPLTNLVLAFISYGLYFAFFFNQVSLIGSFLQVSVWVNLSFFVFNMIPIPPLDGSRVFYAFAPESIQKAMDYMETVVGVFLVYIAILFFGSYLATFMNGAMLNILRLFHVFFSLF